MFIQDFGHGKSAYPVAAELAKLLPEEKIWVVEADIAGFVQRNEQNSPNVPSAKDTKAAYDAVGKAGMSPVLADLNCRRRFIQQHRLADIKGHDVIRGMRYVLHGSVAHHDDDDATLWVNTDQADEVWVKLKRMVEPDTWNVIDSNLAGLLGSDDREKLGIRRVCADDIIEHMRIGSSLNQFDPLQFNDTEIATILKQIHNENLWKSIPLHRTHSDTLVPINNNSYLDPDNLAASQFLNGINLIQISNNSDILNKQNEWIPRWTQNTTIERALAQAKPGQHWKAILASLDQATTEKIPQFRTVAWLPLVSGGYISPEDVIDLEPLASDIDRLASQHDYCYAGIAAIAKEVQQHENFSKLKLCFASDLAGLERLGLLIACSDDYSIGDSSLGDNLESLIDYLSELKSQPAWSIVKNSINAVGIENIIDVQNYIIKAIQKRLASAKLVEILNEISAHRKPNQSDIFNHYLKQLSQYPADLPHALEKIKLLARDGHWESANKLCVGVQGIVKGSVLCQEQAHILQNHLHGLKQNTNNPDLQRNMVAEECSSTIDLEDYFKPWRDLLPSGPIGAFFALMGTSLRNLADEWLKPHSFKYFIDQLNWDDPRSRSSPVWDYQGREPTKQESLDKLEFIPIISNVKEMVVVSLLGEDIHVLVDNEFDSLVLGNLTWAGSRNGKSFFRLPLRELPKQNKYAKTALSNILKKTCECILLEAYRQPAPNLGSLWSSLVESHQLQLQVAHDLILDNLPHDLSNLRSAKNNPKIRKQLEHFKKLKTSRSENKLSNKPIDQIDKDINQAKQDLSHIMTTDPGVQKSVLDGIRVRIKENQYEVSSIAFELLQNADDAVVELQKLMLSDAAVVHPNSHVGRFVMETNGDTVRFLHWGRPINYMGHGTASNSSYGEDLQRMLILAASDKDETTGLTGKFGLGFKSVLLATDTPCILSDDLEVEIVGGCLPVRWSNCDGAKKSLHQHELPDAMGLRGTVVEFVLNAPEKRSQVLDRFEALAGLQCVFSKEIRSIQVNDVRHDWQPDTLFNDLQSIEIGSVRLPDKGGLKKSNLLNFRLADGCFALRLGTRGFVRFQENVTHFPPCVWVTAPTREPAAIGLILNSHFELDTGRGGLTHGESARANLKKARQLGGHASKLVISATRLSQGCWELMKQRLKLTHEMTVPEFWTTFWEQIPTKVADEEDGESARLLSEFGRSLYEGYLSLSGEIPNGLTGKLAAFIHPAAVCLSINPRWEKLSDILTNWSNLIAKFPVSGWVSSSVAHQLKTFNPDLKELSVNFLLDFVTEGSRHCGTELSNTLGELLAQVSPEENDSPKENECVQKAMKRLLFQAKDDSWRVGYELLKEGDKYDEPLLPFAPSSHILHEAYMGQGFAWIQRYANCCLFQADLIAGWILAAPKDAISARVAGLRYLLGNQGVQDCIRRRLPGSWIEVLKPSSPYLKDFTVQEKNQLLGMFSSIPTWKEDIIETPQQSNELKGNDALMAIRDWWYKNRVVQLRKFDDAFWPSNVQRKFDHPSESRESWMTLFAIGLMQRIGIAHDYRNRGFIDSMQSAGFWDVFCNKDPKIEGQAWLTILKEYSENHKEDETYSMWMDSFPRLYRLARWFSVYQHVFQTIDLRSQSEMDYILISKFDPVMCGSGIEAPTLKSSLKLGVHIIIRELLRFGILKSDTAKSWAFKPGRGIKQLFEEIGFDILTRDDLTSVQIHDALCQSLGDDATFHESFDIPLIILHQNPDVLNRILTK